MRTILRLLSISPGASAPLVCALVGALGCASEKEVFTSSPEATSRTPMLDGGASSEAVMDASAQGPIDGGRRSSSSEPDGRDASATTRATQPEICDGEDNDGNGTIDDLDVGHDGICDCLSIATLGTPGGSGQGDVFGAWLAARSDTGAVELKGTTLTPELLRKYQVIVAQDLHNQDPYSPAELDALEQWVHAGGGLLTLIGYAKPDERTNVNAILARFGLSYGAQPILLRDMATSIPVRSWTTPHPVTDGIRAVGVDTGYPVQGGGIKLASEGGFDLLRAVEAGDGHVLAWGDEWITYDSEWENDAEYQVEQLWLNMIKWLTALRVCQVPPMPV